MGRPLREGQLVVGDGFGDQAIGVGPPFGSRRYIGAVIA
jgi:hypothetical protein